VVNPLKTVLFPIVMFGLSLPASAQSLSNYSVGEAQFCTLQDDGQVNCTLTTQSVRLAPPEDLPELTAVTAGDAHACGLTIDGQAICWGDNAFSQLDAPTVDFPLVQINSGHNHTCAIDSAGAAVCWGLNNNLQLEPPEGAIFTKVDAAFTSSCGILVNGDIECWSTDRSRAPEPMEGPFVDLDIVNNGVCGLVDDGSIRCTNGTDLFLENGPYTAMAATRDAVCALNTESTLECETSRFGNIDDYPVGEQFSSIQSTETGFSGIGGSSERNREIGTTMCGERFDGTFQCWAESTRFPGIAEGPSEQDFLTEQRLDLDARVYGTSAVEIFWTPLINPNAPIPRVEVFRNGESLRTVNAVFSFFDSNALTDNTYQIRLIDSNGNAGPLSGSLTVDTLTGTVLFNGEPTLMGTNLNDNFEQEIITGVSFRGVIDGFIASWDVDPEMAPLVDGYEVLLGGTLVGFTRSQLFVDTNADLGDRCFEILAVDAAGTVLDSASLFGRGCR